MLSQVNLPASLYRLILSHAYSTEKVIKKKESRHALIIYIRKRLSAC